MKKLVIGAVALSFTMIATGCGNDANSISAQANKGDGKGYIAGDGTIEQLKAADRDKPVSVHGKLLDGTAWSLDDAKGKIVVLNVWGSWCPPCEAEFPGLEKAWQQLKPGNNVVMMGLDQKDSVEVATAYLKAKKITFPSLAADGGQTLLGLQGKATSFPTTLVLDTQHRIAGRVSGPITTSTLMGLVGDVQKESTS